MPGRDVVGEAIVLLELENRASDELARAVAEFKAETAALGREKAEIKLKVDISEYKSKLAEAKTALKALEEEERRESQNLKTLTGEQHRASTQRLNDVRQEIGWTKKSIDEHNNEIKALQRKQQVFSQVGSMVNQLNKERTASEKQAAAAIRDSSKAEDDAAKASLRRAEAVRKLLNLQKQFIDAENRVNALTKAASKAPASDHVRIEIDARRAEAEMEVLRLKLKAMGHDPVEQKVEVNRGDISKARQALSGIGKAFGFNRTDQIRGLANDLEGLAGKALKARVNVGPLSASLGGLLVGAAAIAPVIIGIVGALGSLVAVTGAAAGGLGGVLGAGLLGGGMAAIGIGSSIKTFVGQIGQANTAMTAYSTAVSKYGQNSKQADKAQKELQSTLKGLPPDVRNAVTGFESLKNRWQGLTQAVAQRDIGRIIGDSFKTVRADMGFFARDTNAAFNAVTTGWEKWMAQLRSGGARDALNNIFSNFNRSIPSIMTGISSLASAFGRMFSQFSNFLPSLTHGFAAWAHNIDQASARSGGFANGVRTMVGALRDFGHFTEAAGRFLLTFFQAGVKPGEGLLNDMTRALDRVTAKMQTVAGQTKLTNFFNQSIGTTKLLFGAIIPLISAFARFSNVMAPVANVALSIVTAFTKLISILVGFTPLRYFAGFLIGLSIIGRLTAALREMSGVAIDVGKRLLIAFATAGSMGPINALKSAFSGFGGGGAAASIEAAGTSAAAEMGAAIEAAGSAAAAEMGAAIASGGAVAAAEEAAGGAAAGAAGGALAGAEGAVAGAAGGQLALFGGEAAAATGAVVATEGAVGGLGATLAALATGPVGLGVLAIGGLTAAIIALGSGADDTTKSEEGLKQAIHGANAAAQINRNVGVLPGIRAQGVAPAGQLPIDRRNVNALQAEYNRLVTTGATNTQHYRDVVMQLTDALSKQRTDQSEVNSSINQARSVHEQAAKAIKTDVTTAQEGLNKARKAYNDELQLAKDDPLFNTANARKQILANISKAQTAYNKALAQQHDVQLRLEADNVNAARAQLGLLTVTNDQAVATGRLADQIKAVGGTTAQKAFSFIVHLPNPADIARISNMINNLSPKDKTSAINILAHTKDASQAIAAINRLQLNEKILNVRSNIGDALAALAQIKGIKLDPKTLRLLHQGDPAVINAVAHINGLGLPAKILRLLGNASDALAKHNQVEALQDIRRVFRMIGDVQPALTAWSIIQQSVHDIHAVVTTVFKTVGKPFATGGVVNRTVTKTRTAPTPGGGLPGRGKFVASHGAEGLSDNPILQEKQIRAAMLASIHPMLDIRRGGLFNKPVYLIGEENRNEYVIATNPAYRKDNILHLGSAAAEFGYRLVPAARGSGRKKPPPKKQHPFSSVYDLPPQDRVGGVGTNDIQTAITSAQSTYNTWNNRIGQQKTVRHGKHTRKELVYPDAKAKAASALKNLQGLQGLLGSANDYIQQFTNLETEITTVGAYMTAANAASNDMSAGYDPFTGSAATKSWDQWKSDLVRLEQQHTDKLTAAADDARRRIGDNGNALNISYVRALQLALGQSIVDLGAAQAQEQAPPAPMTLADFIQSIGQTGTLSQLQYNYALAQTNDVADLPGTPQREDLDSLKDNLSSAKDLMDFYNSILSQTQQTGNLSIMTDAANALTDARNTFTQLQDQFTAAATATGPTQQQLADTARANVLLSYGSNLNSILGLPTMNAGTSVNTALANNVINTLRGPNVPTYSAGGVPSKVVTVTNYYQQPPEDPHLWSQGLSWELEAAL